MKKQSKIVIYGRKSCPFCVEAEKFVNKNKTLSLSKFVSLNSREQFDNKVKELKKKGVLPKTKKFDTVPIIIKDGKYLGGFSELYKKYS